MRRLIQACIRHRRITVATWLVLLVGIGAAGAAVGEEFSTNFDLPDSDSQRAFELLEERFPSESGDGFQIVFEATGGGTLADPANRAAIRETLSEFAQTEVVTGVSAPTESGGAVSPDGTIGLASAQLEGRTFDVEDTQVDRLLEIREQAGTDSLRVELGGDLIRFGTQEEGAGPEIIGVIAAIILLLLIFGSFVAMALPIVNALIALGITISLVTLLTHLLETPEFAPAMAAMIGLGVGIDYALFIVTRFRSNLRGGMPVGEAVTVAMDTAGRAVLFAGATVCVALLGLFAIGVDFLYGPAVAAAVAVLVTMTASLTLLPAVLSKVGDRIDRWRLPGMHPQREDEGSFWSGWSRGIQRRPWVAAISATVLLVVLAIPVFSIQIGNADAGTDAPETTTRQAYDLLAQGFGPGFNGPLLVASELSGAQSESRAALAELTAALEGTEGVAAVQEPMVGPDGNVAAVNLFPTTGPQDEETQELVERLREQAIPPFVQGPGGIDQAYVGGETAVTVDFSSFLAGKLPLFIGVVVALSAILLLVAFRSILVPLKAILMNVLSIGASFGVVVAVFQFGWGNEVIGLSETAPIAAFVPVFVFAIVFGLSMDYEVFLISRVHEEWERRGNASSAVQHGLASTGRVITAAALIMIAVFSGFALGGDLTIKLFGVALASAIFLDAFVIRSLLVPAIMELLGSRAWWLPDWLDRFLPRIRIESEDPAAALTGSGAEDEPEAEPVGAASESRSS